MDLGQGIAVGGIALVLQVEQRTDVGLVHPGIGLHQLQDILQFRVRHHLEAVHFLVERTVLEMGVELADQLV